MIMQDREPITHAPDLTGTHRIWVNANYYLQVDSDGYLMGICYEGALGCVVPLLSFFDKNRLALKIPRMLADTVRENAFISQVVNAEAAIVYRANQEYKAASGLIPVQAYGRDVLRGLRELRNADEPDAQRQDGCILLFSFHKDRNPRICAVKFEGARRVVFPPACDAELAFLSLDLWERVDATARADKHKDAGSYYFEVWRKPTAGQTSGAGQTVVHAPLISSMTADEWPEVWFGALPSILYNWAGGTLQESVSQDRLHAWTVDQHYELGCRVLRGVDTLHSKRFIHGDLRPANIMTCGATNTPDEYVVGDYGSFSEDVSFIGGPPNTSSGHTIVGGLGRHRASVFYAPERRAGIERETADVALILSDLEGVGVSSEYLVYFGWRSQILDPRTNCPDDAILSGLREQWQRMRGATKDEERPAPAGDRLTHGDRLRVREFIFTVLDAEEFDGGEEVVAGAAKSRRMVYRCHRRYAQVLHERISVYQNDSVLPDCTVIGLPNFVELRQWSAATDLYGVGALILYTVFMSGRHCTANADLAIRDQATGDAMGTAETTLTEMLEMLAGVPSFLALWSDLEDFRASLEHPENAGLSGAELSQAELRHRHSTTGHEQSDPHGVALSSSDDPNEHRTIGGFARRTINNLLRSVPNIRCVLQVFQCGERGLLPSGDAVNAFNAAHFLLFVHFVMACLHRRSHLRHLGEGDPRYPFCRDRCDPAVPHGPASEALTRLEELRRRLLQPRYDAIVVHDRQLVDFDPRDVMQIRIEHAQLVREAAIRRRELAESQHHLDDALARLGERERSCSESQDEIERKIAELRESNQARATAQEEAKRLLGELMAAQGAAVRAHEDIAETRIALSTFHSGAEASQAEVHALGRSLADREERLAAALTRCATLESQARDRGASLTRLTVSAEERDGLLQQLQSRSELFDGKMIELMAQVNAGMSHCLDDLVAIRQAAWRVPADRMERLTAILAQWRDWGAQRHQAIARARRAPVQRASEVGPELPDL